METGAEEYQCGLPVMYVSFVEPYNMDELPRFPE